MSSSDFVVNDDSENDTGYISELPHSDTESESQSVNDSKSEGVDTDSSEEYDQERNQYAELLYEVPQEKVSGMIEMVEDLLTGKLEVKDYQDENQQCDNLIFSTFVTGLIVLVGTILGVVLQSKTDFATLR